jgi:hypothetical protein
MKLGALQSWASVDPFPHLVVDDFLDADLALALSRDFPLFDDPVWHTYNNAIEVKKTLNNWHAFTPALYRFFSRINDRESVNAFKRLTQCRLYPDIGLHGAGLHIHGPGGKLNTHLDYSIHPKLGLERRLNLIVYLNPDWQESWGGALGLWRDNNGRPGELVKSIAPLFNRAVVFDTTGAWHGLPEPIACPSGQYRKSLAVYYLCDPREGAVARNRALFAPTEAQAGDREVLELIERRSR